MIKKAGYYFSWLIKYKLGRQKIPLTSSIIITDKCNLKCRHCTVSNLGYEERRFDKIREDIDVLYDKGARVLVITGGEPFLWNDNGYVLEDAVVYAREKGFFRIVICTNGTAKLDSSADYFWVSLDGFFQEHNELRGGIYDKVIENMLASRHNNIYINFTVSKINFGNFDKAVRYILGYKKIKGVLLHLFTPYVNSDKKLILSKAERDAAIDKIIRIKKRHPIRISNTFDGLRALRKNNWERPVWSSIVIDQGEIWPCCCRGGIYNREVCENCGCSPAVETFVLQKLKPLAIIENLRFL